MKEQTVAKLFNGSISVWGKIVMPLEEYED